MQRPAKPCTPVRFRPSPPDPLRHPSALKRCGCAARVVKLVDTGDLKSPGASHAGSIPAPGTNSSLRVPPVQARGALASRTAPRLALTAEPADHTAGTRAGERVHPADLLCCRAVELALADRKS